MYYQIGFKILESHRVFQFIDSKICFQNYFLFDDVRCSKSYEMVSLVDSKW